MHTWTQTYKHTDRQQIYSYQGFYIHTYLHTYNYNEASVHADIYITEHRPLFSAWLVCRGASVQLPSEEQCHSSSFFFPFKHMKQKPCSQYEHITCPQVSLCSISMLHLGQVRIVGHAWHSSISLVGQSAKIRVRLSLPSQSEFPNDWRLRGPTHSLAQAQQNFLLHKRHST